MKESKQKIKEEILKIDNDLKISIARIANNIRAHGDLDVGDGRKTWELKSPPTRGGEDMRDVKAWFKKSVINWLESNQFMSDKEKEDIRNEYKDILA